jgi:hypothetical protein
MGGQMRTHTHGQHTIVINLLSSCQKGKQVMLANDKCAKKVITTKIQFYF